MQKKQIAVLDVGSSKINAVVCESGVNKTFIIKGEYAFAYDGFADGEFLNVKELNNTLVSCVDFLKKTLRNSLSVVYVGVPGCFTDAIVKDSQIGFGKKKKITEADVESLFESAFVMQNSNETLINHSSVVYELDDGRRVANPIGLISETLKGKLSFMVCKKYFYELFNNVIKYAGVSRVEFVASPLSEALYLIPTEVRDRIVELCDIGYITTTFSLIQGDGILYQKSFDYGGGYITASLTEKLGISFEQAEYIKKKINLCRVSNGSLGVITDANGNYFSVDEVNSIVKDSLDVLCENISNAIEDSDYSIPEYVPLLITGGGIAYIRGAKEYVSGRLSSIVSVAMPSVPLMEKPDNSSLLSLLDLVLSQND